MTQLPDSREAALDWLVKTNDPDFDRWDDFTTWLEEDPANADAYHRLADSELVIRPLIEAPPREPVRISSPAPRHRLVLAASVAVLAAAGAVFITPRLMPADYVTGRGEIEIVSLGGRDQLVMNGDTRLSLSGWDRRTIRLDQGQVLLRLRDAGQDKVELESGDLTLVDVGTVFEVSRDGRSTRVVVAEGAVMADPDGARLTLARGQRLDTEDGATILQATAADVGSVGSFETGQLVYLDEPLERVAADLRRSTGIDFSTSAAIRARRFSGTLSITEVKRDPRSLEPLLGVALERSGAGWQLGGRG